MINTIYLRSSWAEQFNTYHTEMKPFYSSGGTMHVQTMALYSVYLDTGYLPELNARFVVLPYEASGLEMIVVIPETVGGVSTIENHIDYLDDDIFSQRKTSTHVNFEMPKFTAKNHFRLKNVLIDVS